MDRLRSMEVFVAVVDAGSFTGAADALEMSAVMVTKHIAGLEKRLAARLLNRTTRRLSLTEIGELYCEQCRQILGLVEQADAGAEALRASARGTLKISAPAAFGTECLAPALAHYLAAYPEVNVELDLSSRITDLAEEGLDAAIRIGDLHDSSMIARRLRPYGSVICASPAYLRKHGKPRTPADLAKHQCLEYQHWRGQQRWHLDPHSSAPHIQIPRLRSNHGQALRRAAIAGLGIIMQAELVLAEDIAKGRLVVILKDYTPPPRPMHLLYPRDRTPTPKLTSFIDFLMQNFGA